MLVILLIVAAIGAGAFFFWKFVLNKPDAAEPTTQKAPPKPAPPPAPTEATAKVALETPPAQDVKSPAGGIRGAALHDRARGVAHVAARVGPLTRSRDSNDQSSQEPVSCTHLTLPTSDLV